MSAFPLWLVLVALFSAPAGAGERYSIEKILEVRDRETQRTIKLHPSSKFTFEVLESQGEAVKVRLFDPAGLEVQGNLWISAEQVKDLLKDEITSGLKATKDGPKPEKAGCCEVVEGNPVEPEPKEIKEANRAPAIAPGTGIVYAPVPPPKKEVRSLAQDEPPVKEEKRVLAQEAPPEKIEGLVLPKEAPLPTPNPRRVAVPPLEARVEPKELPKEEDKTITLPEVVPLPVPNPRRVVAPPVEAVPIPTPRPRPRPRPEVALPEKAPVPTPRPKPEPPARKPAAKSPICAAVQAFAAKGVPEAPLRQAMLFFAKASKDGRIGSRSRYLSIADYSQSSRKKRFYLLDLHTLDVTQEKVSHGAGNGKRGDPEHDGMLNACGGSGSNMTRAGFFKVSDYYFSQAGRYKWPLLTRNPPRNGMKLDGLTPGVNTSARDDGYVMHEAKYNADGNAIMGRSSGCPAFVPGKGKPIMDKLRKGSLHYNFAPVCGSQMKKTLEQVPGWRTFCE